ncbi:hypothetical protein BC827DRAFT_115319 [Russula dissimulans]|nr:hypothetical protein BC827DRAFT_115319 [Russula dissimulans]
MLNPRFWTLFLFRRFPHYGLYVYFFAVNALLAQFVSATTIVAIWRRRSFGFSCISYRFWPLFIFRQCVACLPHLCYLHGRRLATLLLQFYSHIWIMKTIHTMSIPRFWSRFLPPCHQCLAFQIFVSATIVAIWRHYLMF